MKQWILASLLIFSTLISLQPLNAGRQSDKSQNGIYAAWAKTGEPIYAVNEELPLTPASSAKIVTTYCALKKLGIDHRFYTSFFSETPPQNGEIQNLWISGEGDPALVSERLWEAVQQLKAMGLQRVKGNIYIDATFFEANGYPGRQENNERAYNALTSAVSLNFNSVAVQVFPTDQGFKVTLFPETPYFQLNNRLNAGGKRANVFLQSQDSENGEMITVAGNYPRGSGPTTYYRSVQHPALYVGHALVTLLKQSGIPFQGRVAEKKGEGKFLLYKHPSQPLSQIVRDMNKFSNNFMAEQITKYLGTKYFGPPGTTAQGTEVFKNCLREIGVDPSSFILENGSGLSYRNKISAKALVAVLVAGYQDFGIRPDFIASLSVHGVDGTMKKRNGEKGVKGILRAKTGTLNGISSLAGYMPAANGEVIAFAILMTNMRGGAAEAHRLQDSMVLQWSALKH